MRSFLKAWKDLAMPTDAATTATVVQNVGINKPFGLVAAGTPIGPVQAATLQSVADPLDYRWWDQVTMVVDNSTSMGTGPAGGPLKVDAVKSLIHEQVNDLAPAPQGTSSISIPLMRIHRVHQCRPAASLPHKSCLRSIVLRPTVRIAAAPVPRLGRDGPGDWRQGQR